MLSTEKAAAKSLAPEITSGSASNSASTHSMIQEVLGQQGAVRDERQIRSEISHTLQIKASICSNVGNLLSRSLLLFS
jgi:hypothetical protein